jgi:predicted GIY-YIG superfamily endonuclease
MVNPSEYGRNYCVYVHKRASNGVAFYIGISGNRNRPYDLESRSNLHKNITKKHGVCIEIVAEGLTMNEAIRIESEMIRIIGRICDKSGPLANFKVSHFDKYEHKSTQKKRMKRKSTPKKRMKRSNHLSKLQAKLSSNSPSKRKTKQNV